MQLDNTEFGIRLRMTPLTSSEWITMDYKAENRFLSETNALGPLVLRHTVTGTIRMRSGETIIVGGLTMDSEEKSNSAASRRSNRKQQEVWVLLQAHSALNSAKHSK